MKQNSKKTNEVGLIDDSSKYLLLTSEGKPYEIPEEGSLGILAIGYAGIMLWREKKYRSALEAKQKS